LGPLWKGEGEIGGTIASRMDSILAGQYARCHE
jgi:hypothetical protein